MLRQLGWNILRVWSTDWWHDPKKETERLHKSLQEAELAFGTSGTAQPATTNVPVAIANEFDSIEEESPLAQFSSPEVVSTALPGTIPYTPNLPQLSPLPGAEFYEVRHHAAIRDRLLQVTAALEPITLDDATRQVMSTFGLVKLTAKARRHILLLAKSTPGLVLEDDVLWSSTTDRLGWREVRVPDDAATSKRNVDEIPLCELVNCAELVLRQNLSLPRMDLARETARAFGITRLGANMQSRLDTAISDLLAQGRGHQEGDQVRCL